MSLKINGWLTLKVKPRQEKQAQANLLNQGFNCYFPSIYLLKAGEQKPSKKPMFPGYGFVELNSVKSFMPVNSTLGVTRIVHFGSSYPVLAPNILNQLKDVEALSVKRPTQQIKKGDNILILEGPLKGLDGIVSHVNKERIEVLYTLFNQSHKTKLSLHSVKHS